MAWNRRKLFLEAQEQLEKHDYEAADRSFSKILEEDPEAIEALLHRALLRIRLERLEEARADAEKVVSERSEQGVAFMVLGEVLLAMQNYQGAYQNLQKASELEKDNGRAYYQLAMACIGLGKKREAADYLEEALQFERDYTLAQLFSELLSGNTMRR